MKIPNFAWTCYLAVSLCLCLLPARAANAQETLSYNILHSFADGTVLNDGAAPSAALIQGADGNFYGTTSAGGSSNATPGFGEGTLYKYDPTTTEVTILHSFTGTDGDGAYPHQPVLQLPGGNFYGTTAEGGNYSYYGNGAGIIFEYSPSTSREPPPPGFG